MSQTAESLNVKPMEMRHEQYLADMLMMWHKRREIRTFSLNFHAIFIGFSSKNEFHWQYKPSKTHSVIVSTSKPPHTTTTLRLLWVDIDFHNKCDDVLWKIIELFFVLNSRSTLQWWMILNSWKIRFHYTQ